MADFVVHNHGSIAVVTPTTDAANAWVEEHVAEDRLTWGAHGAFAVEPRHLVDLLVGAQSAGFTVGSGEMS